MTARRITSVSCSKGLDAFVRLAHLRRQVTIGRRRPGPVDTVVAVGDLEPTVQAGLGDPEVLRDLASGAAHLRATAITPARKPAGNGFGTRLILPSKDESSQVRSQPGLLHK